MGPEPLYTLRFVYPDSWQVDLRGEGGTEEEHFLFAEGSCQGRITGRFRGANHPRRRTDRTAVMNLQGFIETPDPALILVDLQGYGRSFARSQELYAAAGLSSEATGSRRQVVGFARHVSEHAKYRWLNDAVCSIVGEVRSPVGVPSDKIKQADVRLVFSVTEMIWEPPPE
ncbi:MAG: DUF3237 family protein [Thermoplasmata archaeon]|nr:DUF3237 family protein [Thermoplasmata archaeon]